jgi:hypothetical protein
MQPIEVSTNAPRISPRSSTATGCLARAKGLLLLAGAIGVGGLGWLVLNILANNLRRTPDHAERVAEFSTWLIGHRGFVPLAALPVASAAIWLMTKRRHTAAPPSMPRSATPWIILALATIWLVVVFGMVLVAFVQFLAPLYQYQDLG